MMGEHAAAFFITGMLSMVIQLRQYTLKKEHAPRQLETLNTYTQRAKSGR